MTPHIGVKGQNVSYFQNFLNATLPTYYIARSCNLGQNDKWVSGYKKYQQFDLKGHVGVTEVKKVNHVKNMKTALISKLIMSSCRQ